MTQWPLAGVVGGALKAGGKAVMLTIVILELGRLRARSDMTDR